MTEALRACPWCDTVPNMTDNLMTDSGSRAQIGKWAWIECDCGARSPDVRANWGGLPDWQQDAADAWNRRAPVALPTREEVAEVIWKAWAPSCDRCDVLRGCGCSQAAAEAVLALMGKPPA